MAGVPRPTPIVIPAPAAAPVAAPALAGAGTPGILVSVPDAVWGPLAQARALNASVANARSCNFPVCARAQSHAAAFLQVKARQRDTARAHAAVISKVRAVVAAKAAKEAAEAKYVRAVEAVGHAHEMSAATLAYLSKFADGARLVATLTTVTKCGASSGKGRVTASSFVFGEGGTKYAPDAASKTLSKFAMKVYGAGNAPPDDNAFAVGWMTGVRSEPVITAALAVVKTVNIVHLCVPACAGSGHVEPDALVVPESLHGTRVVHLVALYTHEYARRLGLGEGCVRAVTDFAAQRQARAVVLDAAAEAVPFYAKLGFTLQLAADLRWVTCDRAPDVPVDRVRDVLRNTYMANDAAQIVPLFRMAIAVHPTAGAGAAVHALHTPLAPIDVHAPAPAASSSMIVTSSSSAVAATAAASSSAVAATAAPVPVAWSSAHSMTKAKSASPSNAGSAVASTADVAAASSAGEIAPQSDAGDGVSMASAAAIAAASAAAIAAADGAPHSSAGDGAHTTAAAMTIVSSASMIADGGT